MPDFQISAGAEYFIVDAILLQGEGTPDHHSVGARFLEEVGAGVPDQSIATRIRNTIEGKQTPSRSRLLRLIQEELDSAQLGLPNEGEPPAQAQAELVDEASGWSWEVDFLRLARPRDRFVMARPGAFSVPQRPTAILAAAKAKRKQHKLISRPLVLATSCIDWFPGDERDDLEAIWSELSQYVDAVISLYPCFVWSTQHCTASLSALSAAGEMLAKDWTLQRAACLAGRVHFAGNGQFFH